MGYLREAPLDETNFPPFAQIKNAYGFIPNLFRAQTLRPDIIEANLALGKLILWQPGALSRKDKEYIFLVCSPANLSTYCVTAHCEIIRMLKLEGPDFNAFGPGTLPDFDTLKIKLYPKEPAQSAATRGIESSLAHEIRTA